MLTRALALLIVALVACDTKGDVQKGIEAMWAGQKPDQLPVMLNKELPFRYPQELYNQKVQGNVTLHIFIDKDGNVKPESTFVLKSSGYPALDSAAVSGSSELKFIPAKLKGEAFAIPILFPVHFRHPDGPPVPEDTAPAKRP